jgi:hypothetical protein
MTAEHREVPSEPGHIALTTLLDGAGAEVGNTIMIEGGEGILLMLT